MSFEQNMLGYQMESGIMHTKSTLQQNGCNLNFHTTCFSSHVSNQKGYPLPGANPYPNFGW